MLYHYVINHYYYSTGSAPACKRLKPGSVPSKFPWDAKDRTDSASERRLQRAIRRSTTGVGLPSEDAHHTNCRSETTAQSSTVPDVGVETYCNASLSAVESATQTDSTQVCSISTSTDTAIKPSWSVHNFVNDNEAIHYYTGLASYIRFCFVLHTLGPAAYHLNYILGAIHTICVFDQFFLTLIKLRRHTPNFELSRLFGISEADVYNIVFTWIRFMAVQWGEITLWPTADMVSFFMPSGFAKHFRRTRVILDCTECPVKKPKRPVAQQATFSTYKNRNTVKTLIGITPGGLCSHVSPTYGGSTSDRQILERSNLPTSCDPGDSVMVDKGFNVQDLFIPYDVLVNIPTFFKKQNRLSCKSVLEDRRIASKRVHVERIIGLAKTYKILTEPMNSTETLLSSDIVFVCFMLCNFRNGIVPRHA